MQTFCGLTTDGMLDYLADIYRLDVGTDRVTTSALAESMHVTPAAVSSMLRRLRESDFIARSTTDGIRLTEQGRLAALQLIRRHRLLEVFLIKVMGFTWDQVDFEAHRLQHAVSAAFEERMDRLCDYPKRCPHGDPIPSKDGVILSEPECSVLEMTPSQSGILRRVGNKEPGVLRYLSRLTLTPGRILKLVELAPYDGPVTIELVGDDENTTSTQILGNALANQLFVASS